MDDAKKARLEKHGWRIGSVDEFLGLTPEESGYIELKLKLSRAIRERRQLQNVTQVTLATKLGSSQSRVAKIEKNDPSVSVDLLIKSLFALNAKCGDIAEILAD